MINRLEIRNWQSLVKVDLNLGALTAIVGPSSCGKTAVMRAIRALASNVRGGGSITSGAKTSAITAHTETHKVTWQRGVNDGGRYVVADLRSGHEDTFTKLAGAVPSLVTDVLHIAPAPTAYAAPSAVSALSLLNIDTQFGPPFLLTESGASVARLLGTLTNVSRILAAVQEANRRRVAAMSTLRVREGDLTTTIERAEQFRTLPARLAARERAEAHADSADRLLAQVSRLGTIVDTLAIAEATLSRSAQRPPLPDDTALWVAVDSLNTYQQRIRTWVSANNAVAVAADHARLAEQAEQDAQRALDEALAIAGWCPTCGQTVPAHSHGA